MLESACYPDVRKLLPWDECFAAERRRAPSHPDMQDVTDEDPADARAQTSSSSASADDDMVACDDGNGHGCGKPVKLTDEKCPHCGLVYDVEPEKPEPKPEPQRRSRAEAKAAAAAGGAGKKDKLPF